MHKITLGSHQDVMEHLVPFPFKVNFRALVERIAKKGFSLKLVGRGSVQFPITDFAHRFSFTGQILKAKLPDVKPYSYFL